MTKSEIILMHEKLVRERRKLATTELNKFLQGSDETMKKLCELDGLIGRYGQVFNPRIAEKARLWLALV